MDELVPIAVALEPLSVFVKQGRIALPDRLKQEVHGIDLMRGISIPVPSGTPGFGADAVIVNHRSGIS